jgi:hypothetical protein
MRGNLKIGEILCRLREKAFTVLAHTAHLLFHLSPLISSNFFKFLFFMNFKNWRLNSLTAQKFIRCISTYSSFKFLGNLKNCVSLCRLRKNAFKVALLPLTYIFSRLRVLQQFFANSLKSLALAGVLPKRPHGFQTRSCVTSVLILLLLSFSFADVVSAQTPASPNAAQSTKSTSTSTTASNPAKFNETFDVSNVLKLPHQSTAKFLDKKGESGGFQPVFLVIITVINMLMYLIGSLAILVLVAAGVLRVVSGGDSQRVEQSNTMIFYSIFGLVVAFSAFIIATFVQSIFAV